MIDSPQGLEEMRDFCPNWTRELKSSLEFPFGIYWTHTKFQSNQTTFIFHFFKGSPFALKINFSSKLEAKRGPFEKVKNKSCLIGLKFWECSLDAKRKLWWWFQLSSSIRAKTPHFPETWSSFETSENFWKFFGSEKF